MASGIFMEADYTGPATKGKEGGTHQGKDTTKPSIYKIRFNRYYR